MKDGNDTDVTKLCEVRLKETGHSLLHNPTAADGAQEQLALSEVLSALSVALDLTEDAVPGHAIRSCLIGMRIGIHLELEQSQLSDLYYALLLKDVGCSSNAARMCTILGADDRAAKRRVKTVDWTRVSVDGLRLAWVNSLPGANKLQKALRVVELGLGRERNNAEVIGIRCDRGAEIVRKIGLSEGCAQAIYSLDEHWNGTGYPDRSRGDEAPLLARIVGIAQHLDVFASEQSRERALVTMVERSGTWFDPELVKIAASLYRNGTLWTGCHSPEEQSLVMQMEPGTMTLIGTERVDQVCEAFADVVDAKSPFTYRHSLGVRDAAVGLAVELGYGAEQCRRIDRAALLHDLGKLRVSNCILDKQTPLDAEEWRVVQEHPELSRRILERIPSFAAISQITGKHHERLDGSGYPHQLTAAELTLDDRIVAMADFYGALSEDRPYRAGLPPDEVLRILSKEVPKKLDAEVFGALKRWMSQKGNRPLQRSA